MTIENLGIGYASGKRSKLVCDKINFSLEEGETVALIGHNGIGKSTFLKTIVGLLPPISGSVMLHNKKISEYSLQERSRLISFVSTEIIKVVNLSVYDLVALGRFPYTNWLGKLEKFDEELVLESIENVGMLHHKNSFVNELSDGERQRVMIARALAQDTKLIFLDEPTAYLDLKNKYEIILLLMKLAKSKKKSIVFSTHDLHIALQMTDKIWLMTEMDTKEGAPEDLISKNYMDLLFKDHAFMFDYEKMNFVLKKEAKHTVHLIGEGPLLKITRSALRRIGIEQSIQSETELRVLQNNDQSAWLISFKDLEIKCDSIYCMCKQLKRMFNE